MTFYQPKEDYFLLNIRVIPKASRQKIDGVAEGQLKIKLNSFPEDGKANKELIALLSKKLKVAKSKIVIVSGETNRNKVLKIVDINMEKLDSLIPFREGTS